MNRHVVDSARALCVAICFALPLVARGATVNPPGARLQVSLSPDAIVRDGNAPVTVTAHLLIDGDAPAEGTTVRVAILGDARFVAGTTQATLRVAADGALPMALLPGAHAQRLPLRFRTRAGEATVVLVQRVRVKKPLVVGYATAGLGPVPGNIEAPDAAPNGTNTRRGAVSVYGTGRIAKNTRGVFAYDSTDSLEQTIGSGPFLSNPNDRPFPAYGDTSLRYDDALSVNRWYARIENGTTSAQWGQFYGTAGRSLPIGGYAMLLNGAAARFGSAALHGTAFTAKNNVAYARQLLSPTGLGIADRALHPDIVVGSDILTLVVLDAHTGAVLSQRTLVNGSDYSLDYANGLIRFITPILPYDAQLNPQLVVAQYEYGGAGAKTTLSGGSGAWRLSRAATARAWYLNDASGATNLDLLGEAFVLNDPNLNLTFSHERSNGFLPQLVVGATPVAGGDAYGMELHAHTARARYDLAYADTAAGYENPFGAYASAGLRSVRARARWSIGRIAAIAAGLTSATNAYPGYTPGTSVNNASSTANASLTVRPNARLSYHVGVGAVAGNANGTLPVTIVPTLPSLGAQGSTIVPPMVGLNAYEPGSGHALQASAGARWHVTKRASLSLERTSNLSGSTDPYAPAQTQAGADLDVGSDGRIFVRQSWLAQSADPLAASQAGAAYAASARTATTIGFSKKVGSATLESGYAVEHTASGSDLYDAIGVSTTLASSKNFSQDAFLQVGQALTPFAGAGTSAPFFVVGGTSLNYQHASFKSSAALAFRSGYAGGSTVQLGAAGPISPAVSLFGSMTGDYTALVRNEEVRGGLAYRPSRNDRYVTLASIDSYQSNLTNYDAYITNVAQVQELYRPSTRTELAGSLAYKLTGDAYFAPHTSIYGLRGDQRIGPRLDLGAEYHWSDVAPIAGSVASGFDAEVGYRVGATLRVAAGYNFTGFADPATAINPTHRGFYATVSTYIDRIFGWGEEHR